MRILRLGWILVLGLFTGRVAVGDEYYERQQQELQYQRQQDDHREIARIGDQRMSSEHEAARIQQQRRDDDRLAEDRRSDDKRYDEQQRRYREAGQRSYRDDALATRRNRPAAKPEMPPASPCRPLELNSSVQTETAKTGYFTAPVPRVELLMELKGTERQPLQLLSLKAGLAVDRAPRRFIEDSQTTCTTCLTFAEFVGPATGDWRFFRAQQGELAFARVDRNPRDGDFEAKIINLELVEWDLKQDRAVKNGACLRTKFLNIKAQWHK